MCSALQMDSALIFFATIAAAVAFVGVGIGTVHMPNRFDVWLPCCKKGCQAAADRSFVSMLLFV